MPQEKRTVALSPAPFPLLHAIFVPQNFQSQCYGSDKNFMPYFKTQTSLLFQKDSGKLSNIFSLITAMPRKETRPESFLFFLSPRQEQIVMLH